MLKACFISENQKKIDYVFPEQQKEEIRKSVILLDTVIAKNNLEANKELIKDVEIAFSTWEMSKLTREELDTYFPHLKVLLYAAGSVRSFATPFLEKGITIINAA